MDLAETTQTNGQGELLGRHKHQFGAVSLSLDAFTATVTNLSTQMQDVQIALSTSQGTAPHLSALTPPPAPPQPR